MKRLLILSSVRWNFTWQRHHSIAVAAADAGYLVTFVEPGPRSIMQVVRFFADSRDRKPGQENPIPAGIEVCSYLRFLLLLPAAVLRSRMRFAHSVLYVPRVFDLVLCLLLSRKRTYDCVVDWGAAPKEWYPPRLWSAVEKIVCELQSRALFRVCTDSDVLADRFADECVLVLPAVDPAFASDPWGSGCPNRVGYFGSVRSAEIDVQKLIDLAGSGFDVVTIGPCDRAARELLRESPVTVLDAVPVAELLRIIDSWEYVVLPYLLTERSRTLVPAKIWNALATRKVLLLSNISLPSDSHEVEVATLVQEMSAVRLNSEATLPTWSDRFNQIIGELR